jgi:Na+-transporting NADH:ubiquinone oxidoreductase subunit A
MGLHRTRKGLELPIEGAPNQRITKGPRIGHVAFMADDFHGLKPRLQVEVDQEVRRGQLLLEDAAIPGVRHTAPGAGRVASINRGERRALQSIVIELTESERRGAPTDAELEVYSAGGAEDPERLGRTQVRDLLVRSGLWTAFRTRPFSKVPHPDSRPDALFVTAIDTNPLAADPQVVLAESVDDFDLGLRAVATLSGGGTYLCVRAGSGIGDRIDAPVAVEEFDGPHPAGAVGLHIHLLAPVGRGRTVWSVGYQDVVSIGRLLRSGTLDVERVIAIGGPPVADPRLVRTRVGASVADFERSEGLGGDVRWISGSVLSGKAAHGDVFGYMGRYDTQLSVLREGGEREFLAWLRPGVGKFSALPAFLSKLLGRSSFDLTTDAYGSRRAIIPIGVYERVMPMDILPTFLLRALAVDDIERAEQLGCLELDEEDLALCSFVDPGKADFGPMLRRNLELIEKSG